MLSSFPHLFTPLTRSMHEDLSPVPPHNPRSAPGARCAPPTPCTPGKEFRAHKKRQHRNHLPSALGSCNGSGPAG